MIGGQNTHIFRCGDECPRLHPGTHPGHSHVFQTWIAEEFRDYLCDSE